LVGRCSDYPESILRFQGIRTEKLCGGAAEVGRQNFHDSIWNWLFGKREEQTDVVFKKRTYADFEDSGTDILFEKCDLIHYSCYKYKLKTVFFPFPFTITSSNKTE
jgi:hypothetical protein